MSEQILFQPVNDFSSDIFSQLNAVNENVIVSPFSILSSLILLLWGAKENTRKEIANVVKIQDKPDLDQAADNLIQHMNSFTKNITQKEPTLKINDRVFVKRDSEVKVSSSFPGKTSIQQIDFGKSVDAAKAINDWVKRSTEGLLTEIVNSNGISSDTVMQVLNTVYFKGSWMKAFDKELTFDSDFKNSDGSVSKVDMLRSSEKLLFGYVREPDVKAEVIELRYANSNLAMLVVLPSTELGIEGLIKDLSKTQDRILKTNLRLIETDLQLPKFKIENTLELTTPLQKMGMKDAFNGANFNGMLITSQPIRISDAKHVAVIEVDEKGTEAAAATKIEIVSYSLEETASFICNRPFMFYIIDHDSRIPFFVGAIKKLPNKSSSAPVVTETVTRKQEVPEKLPESSTKTPETSTKPSDIPELPAVIPEKLPETTLKP